MIPEETVSDAYVPGGLRLDDESAPSGVPGMILRCGGYIPRNRDWNFSRVFSPYWRLYLNFGKGNRIVHAGRAVPLVPGRFVLIPENVLFHCRSRGGAPGHLYLHFNLPPGAKPLLDGPVAVAASPLGAGLAAELVRALAASRARRAGHQAAALVHWVLASLADKAPLARLSSAPLQKALAFVERHPAADLSNAALARAAGVSVRGLGRLFRGELGRTPQAHVRETRLREAARRLAQDRDSIERIADDLGFPNRFYFTRCFTRHLRCSPGEFRRRTAARQAGNPPPAI